MRFNLAYMNWTAGLGSPGMIGFSLVEIEPVLRVCALVVAIVFPIATLILNIINKKNK